MPKIIDIMWLCFATSVVLLAFVYLALLETQLKYKK